MEKIFFITVMLLLISCKKEQVQLPKSDRTVLKDIKDHSPVYMFFKVNEKDTTIKVNRQNTISSTNWVFNIDKRLPLRLVIPEIIKLQEKKKNSSHKREGAIDVFSYADSIGNNLAFVPFTDMQFRLDGKRKIENIIIENTSNFVFNGNTYEWTELQDIIDNLSVEELQNLELGFNEQISYNDFILVLTKFKIDAIKVYTFKK